MIPMKKIAELCGVSEATVSRAMRDQPGVKPSVRKRIRSVAEQYHYRPNALVRSLQSRQTMTVGIAQNVFSTEFAGHIAEGAMKFLSEHDYLPFILNWNHQPRGHEHLLRSMAERRVDGILMHPPYGVNPREYITEMQAMHVPVVLMDQVLPGYGEDYDYVGSDEVPSARQLMEHVISLGHERIAILCDPVLRRREGFIDAMLRRGVPLCPEWKRGWLTPDEIKKLLLDRTRPTAFVCGDDNQAAVVYSVAQELGMRIPEDLSVTGFANLWISLFLWPKLTTVRQDAVEIGRRSAELLLRRIRERRETPAPSFQPEKILLPTELIIRGSTGPVPK